MTALAVIPARGGSKGIPRKNLLDVSGKPLIVWTIEQALAVPELRVVVSTEDAEIAEVSRAAGAEVVDRPAELARDETATEPVVLHAIDAHARDTGADPDVTMLLQATSPLRRPGTLARALSEFGSGGFDSLVGVVPTPPFLWAQGDIGAIPHWDWQRRLRRQDMPPGHLRYRETGSVYVTRTSIYRENENRLGGRIGLFVMHEDEGVDIDTLHDLNLASAMLNRVGQA